MSVKLPLIIKRQVKPSPRKKSQPFEQQQPPKRIPSQEHYQEDYQEDQFEEDAVEEQAQPLQTITVLKKQSQPIGKLESQLINAKEEQPKQSEPHKQNQQNKTNRKEELEKILQQKIQLVVSLKESVNDRKKEIKNIGQQIDKDLNKSLLKSAKQSTVSIRDIFSAPPKSNNKRINDLNEQLKTVRFAIKKLKIDIQKINEGFMDPVIALNQQKGIEFQARIRIFDEDIRHIEKEKEMLAEQIARGNKDFNEEDQKQKADDYNKLNASLAEVLVAQKECKNSIYQVDKEDILHMEKIKFFQEKQGGLSQVKKIKPSQKDKLRIDEQIRQLIIDINDTIEERNKAQSQKKSNIKSLTNQIASIEAKNWDLCNKLRQIDSFLLQYYEKKSKKKQIKNPAQRIQKQSEAPFEKSASGRIEPHSNFFETPIKTIDYENDKNKRPIAEVILVQKKKNYEFSFKEADDNDVQLSDQFLGSKLNILKLILTVDEGKLYNMKAVYETNLKQIEGYVMGSKSVPESAKIIQFQFNRLTLQIINFMHVGYNESHLISYFHIVTTQGKEHKWGNAEHSIKSDQKHIKKYQFCYIKAKMTHNEQENLFCVNGVTLSTIYLSAK